jgi:hypothetical protein
MLVTRQCEPEQHRWSSKLETIAHKPKSPRMSGYDGALPTQPDWQGQYSFLSQGESNIFGSPYDQASSSGKGNESTPPQRSSTGGHDAVLERTRESQRDQDAEMAQSRALDPSGLQQRQGESLAGGKPKSRDHSLAITTDAAQMDALSSERPGLPTRLNQLSSTSSPRDGQDAPPGAIGNDDTVLEKDEDDDVLDDDEMLEAEGDSASQPMSAAERTAARRKMKRFRLTHQQTRFLMSEFAKQPHPDAAHRERLSREIPGLSPRQVQVWFQNRRAKIKRLTADDRDRMIKMRAVPDGFDNIQALHSPYGAVHGLATPISSPVDFGNSSYTDHVMRPLMVDTMRRDDGEDHLSPTGLSPAFGSIGFTPPGSIGNSDVLSPLSPGSTDRSYYSSHLTSPLGPGPRSSNPFARQNSLDSGVQMHSQSRQQIRPLQPLHLRDSMSRSRSENLQSPLRSSMSWKGDAIDYANYSASGSPGSAGRHHSVYQSDAIGNTPGGGLSYEPGSYSGSSPPNINYASVQPPTLQQPQNSRSRLRAASATLPLGLDLRNQYRPVSSSHAIQSPGQASTPRAASASFGSSAAYTSSYPSAPLTAPVDFHPRTPGIRTSVSDYSTPQLSAPIAPSHDFAQALHGNMPSSQARTPMRDSFGGGPLGVGQGHASSERGGDYFQETMGGSGPGLKHERSSFSLPQGPHTAGSASASQPYGRTS